MAVQETNEAARLACSCHIACGVALRYGHSVVVAPAAAISYKAAYLVARGGHPACGVRQAYGAVVVLPEAAHEPAYPVCARHLARCGGVVHPAALSGEAAHFVAPAHIARGRAVID